MPLYRNWLGVSGITTLAVLTVGLMVSFPSINQMSSAQEVFGADEMQQAVNSYCLACHNDVLAKIGRAYV